eukprot:SAG11_NODE_38488_length_252_cov_0.673203_1_plen_77_part_10
MANEYTQLQKKGYKDYFQFWNAVDLLLVAGYVLICCCVILSAQDWAKYVAVPTTVCTCESMTSISDLKASRLKLYAE